MITTYQKHRVLGFIGNINLTFKNLRYIPDAGVRERVMMEMYEYFHHRTIEMLYPLKFKSYLNNVIFSISKKNLEQGLKVLDYE